MSRFNRDDIEFPDAYERAIKARIMMAKKAKNIAKWELIEDRKNLYSYIERRANKGNTFYQSMYDAFEDWGCPSDKMIEIARRDMLKSEAHFAAKRAERAERDANSQPVGAVGDRLDLVATVTFQTSFDTDFGTKYVTAFLTDEGNVLIHKGKIPGYMVEREMENRGVDRNEKGNLAWIREDFVALKKDDKVKIRATVKAHEVRQGVNQTVIARPKFSEVES